MIELKQRHGEKLETMATEQVREQLLARGVTDADLKGPCGGSKRVGTLRKMLLACADVVSRWMRMNLSLHRKAAWPVAWPVCVESE